MKQRIGLCALALSVAFSVIMSIVALGGDKAPAVTNTTCPVAGPGNPVDPKARVEHDGQYVYFCCEACAASFKKDPTKYLAAMSPEDRKAISVNETCPLSGEKIESRTYRSELNGRLVYFCCEHCKATFDKKNGLE